MVQVSLKFWDAGLTLEDCSLICKYVLMHCIIVSCLIDKLDIHKYIKDLEERNYDNKVG